MRKPFYLNNPKTLMKKDEYEIVERSSGYWITDDFGVVNGPYDTVNEAENDIPKQAALQYPLLLDLKRENND